VDGLLRVPRDAAGRIEALAVKARAAEAVSPWTKLRIALAVGLSLALFAVAAGLLTWLAERPGLRARADLTQARRNTLDPVLADIVDKLPEPATIEVFFKPMPRHLAAAGNEAQGRMRDLLYVLQNAAPEKIKVVDHSGEDVATAREALLRLRVDGDEFGLVVVHRGKQRARLALFVDLADLDFGSLDPNRYVPARITAFRGEQALAVALKRVSADTQPKVYFTTGHGERELYGAASGSGNENRELGALATALVDDGFAIERFDGKGVPVPEDCAALALVDPTQSLSEAEVGAIHAYVARGGRLLVTGSHRDPDGEGSTRALAARYGVDIGAGYVAELIAGPGRYVDGLAACANVFSGPDALQVRHPVTESLAKFGRTVLSQLARPLARQAPPSNVVLTELVRSGEDAWVDLPGANGEHDWRPDREREVTGRRFALAYAAQVSLGGAASQAGEEAQGRVIVLGSPELLSSSALETNKDFALNAFNWLAAREYRLSVAPRTEERRVLDVRRAENLVKLRALALFLLPGLCLVLGLFTWHRRRR
jgi:hypothetical protein